MPDEETVGDDGADSDYGDPVQELDAIFQKTRGETDVCISGENNKTLVESYITRESRGLVLLVLIPG